MGIISDTLEDNRERKGQILSAVWIPQERTLRRVSRHLSGIPARRAAHSFRISRRLHNISIASVAAGISDLAEALVLDRLAVLRCMKRLGGMRGMLKAIAHYSLPVCDRSSGFPDPRLQLPRVVCNSDLPCHTSCSDCCRRDRLGGDVRAATWWRDSLGAGMPSFARQHD